MKIPAIQRNTQTKNTIWTQIKRYIYIGKSVLKGLKEDVFEYVSPRPYILVNGKKVYRTKHVMIDGKKVPKSQLRFVNWDEADWVGVKWSEIKFYPEDIEKMKNMKSARERINYKRKLIEENKYLPDELIDKKK